MKHIVMYSGGAGSKQAAKRVSEKNGIDSLYLLFADTLIEDRDTYRYMIESALRLYGVPAELELLLMVEAIYFKRQCCAVRPYCEESEE